ncbi:MAG: L-threonylcarbamoyladenylate synthase [Tepidamorphaceae bacterium]
MTSARVLDPHDASAIAEAAAALKAGALVSFPTETVYGLGADAANARAVARIYSAKGRPSFNPLIAHLADMDAARQQGTFNEVASALADRFWPGPLTLVVPRKDTSTVSDLATAGLDSVALRVPDNAVAHALLSAFGGPVVAPSANRSGYVSATTAQHVAGDLGEAVSIILDAGPTGIGIESTVIDCTADMARILRPGAVTREAVRNAIGDKLAQESGENSGIIAPGMLASHYAPNARVRLNATDVQAGEAAITFNAFQPAGIENASSVFDLSPTGDLEEAAANLFTALRELDTAGSIAVCPVPCDGLGEAINDRLRRAAAPRDS